MQEQKQYGEMFKGTLNKKLSAKLYAAAAERGVKPNRLLNRVMAAYFRSQKRKSEGAQA